MTLDTVRAALLPAISTATAARTWSSQPQSGIAVLLNNGNGTLAGEVNYALGQFTFTAAIGDLNGDGNLDLTAIAATPPIVEYHYDQSDNPIGTIVVPGHVDARVLLGDGSGLFTDSGATYDHQSPGRQQE